MTITAQPREPEVRRPAAPAWPPTPEALIVQFVGKLSKMPRGSMAPSDNPGYVMVAAAEGCRDIERILGEAQEYVKQGYSGARDVARSYRAVYTVLSAIEESVKSKKYGVMQDVLRLGYFAGMDEATLRNLCLSSVVENPKEQAMLDAVSTDELRHHLLQKQIGSQPDMLAALRNTTLEFDKKMIQHGLYSFVETVRQSPGYSAQRLIDKTQKAALGYLGGGTALAWLGWLSPEIAIAGALAGTAASSGVFLVNQLPNLSPQQLTQISSGLGELTKVVDDLEKAADEREAAEKSALEAKQNRKGR